LYTIIVSTFFFCVDIGGIVDQNSLSFLCFLDIGGIVVHQCLSFPKENLNSDGQQFHKYQENKRKFKQ
jgi:hypothetical protein